MQDDHRELRRDYKEMYEKNIYTRAKLLQRHKTHKLLQNDYKESQMTTETSLQRDAK